MSVAFGFEPFKDDDELLERLSTRESTAEDGLEGLLASWTASIDEDYQQHISTVGPLGLRRTDESTPRVRVITVPRSRAVALVGAMALTLSGGGVAAALTGNDLPAIVHAIKQVAGPHLGEVPTDTPTTAMLPSLVAQAQEVAPKDPSKALGMIEVIRSLAPKDAQGRQITQQVDDLASKIASQSAPSSAVAAPIPSKTATNAPSVSSSVSAPVVVAEAPSASAATSATASSSTGGSSASTAGESASAAVTPVPTPSSSATSERPADTTSPSTPVSTLPPTDLGNTGGHQTAGHSTSPTRDDEPGGKQETSPAGQASTSATSQDAVDEDEQPDIPVVPVGGPEEDTSSPTGTRAASPTTSRSSASSTSRGAASGEVKKTDRG